jgi:Flp pilus assembly protein TadG
MIQQLRSERGSTLVELTLILPVFLLLLLGAVDLGRGFRTYLALTNAAQEGARWLTTHPSDSNGAQARVVAEVQQVGLAANEITITITPVKGTYIAGDLVTVQVDHSYIVLFGALTGLPSLPLRSKSVMRVLYG